MSLCDVTKGIGYSLGLVITPQPGVCSALITITALNLKCLGKNNFSWT